MKHLYIVAIAALLGLSAQAQYMPVSVAKGDVAPRYKTEANVLPPNRATIWTNDISDCSTWTFGNGSGQVNQPWTDVDLNFECSTVGSSGFYNQWAGGDGDGAAAPGMNSTTADNGFLLVDSDLYGAEVQYDAAYIENSWAQTAQPINLADHPYVTMTFETRYRCWDNGASDGSEKCFIEISRDGTSWPTLTSSYVETWDQEGIVVYGEDSVQCRYEVFPESETGFQTDDPSVLDFDISAAAGGQETVWIRFRWVGTWGYAWEIDDIEVYDTPANDVRIDNYASSTNYLQTGWYENGTWALSQIPSYLEAGAKVYNVGYVDQTNVAIDLDVNGTVYTSDTIDVLAYQANDTLRMPYQPTMLGDYTLTYQLFADSTDENPGNNTITQSFSVADLQYGRDNGEIVTVWPPADNSLVDYMAMPLYDIHNDVTIYGVDVAVMAGAEPADVRGMLMDMTLAGGLPPADQYFGTLIESEVVELATDYTNAAGAEEITWITLAFEEPYEAAAGAWLGAAFESFGGYNVQTAESQFVEDGTAWYYGPFGANQTYGWYFSNNVPMVRLNLDPSASTTLNVNDVTAMSGFELFPAFPNPAVDETRMQFRLDRAAEVTFELRDITGKLVEVRELGTQPAGYSSFMVNTSALSAGSYTATLNVDNARTTQKLMVK